MPFYQFYQKQNINASVNEVWDFIASPEILKHISPPNIAVRITTPNLPEKMYAGMMVGYSMSPFLGIRTHWLAEMTQVVEKHYFVDEQRVGPYKMWQHQHFVEAIEGGTQMRDIITYQPPMGFLGAIANTLFIRSQLKGIFAFRKTVLEKRFGRWEDS